MRLNHNIIIYIPPKSLSFKTILKDQRKSGDILCLGSNQKFLKSFSIIKNPFMKCLEVVLSIKRKIDLGSFVSRYLQGSLIQLA